MKKNKEFDKSILILITIVLITIITAFSLYLNVRVDKVSQIIKEHGVVTTLIVIENENNIINTQVLIINSDTKKGALIDIPENTGTIITKKQMYSRIDTIYKEFGVESYRKKISELLEIDIPFHIIIEENNFSDLIDLLDGLDLFISKSVEEESKDLLIPSGSVVLEGYKVLQYLSLNNSSTNIDTNISRRQRITQAFLAQIKIHSAQIIKESTSMEIFSRFKSNLDYTSLQKYFDFLGSLEVDRLVLQGILGESRIVSNEELIFPYNNENLIKVRVKRILINLNNPEVISDEKLNFNIQVLNGTNQPGLASRTAKYLNSFGYNISGYGNAGSGNEEHEFTSILIRKGNREAAERIGELINCEYIHTQIEEGIDDTIDFTIILGKDFDGKRVKN
ncbi:MAG: LCP family protein [Spirochaetales bacterium]|nr:LCP family protein [Spirochaetales bacterium]